MPLTQEGITLFRTVQEQFRKNPLSCNMDSYIEKLNGEIIYPGLGDEYEKRIQSCNTVGCIAGWICIIKENAEAKNLTPADMNLQIEPLAERAANYLGFYKVAYDKLKLFYKSMWPHELWAKLQEHTEGTPEYAAVVNEAIDWFISEHSPMEKGKEKEKEHEV